MSTTLRKFHADIRGRLVGSVFCFLVCAALVPVNTAAQDSKVDIAPSAAAEASQATDQNSDAGFGNGRISIHPGLQLEAGFDNNVFFNDQQESVVSAPTLGVVPSLGFKTKKGSKVDFELNSKLSYLHFFSDDERVTNHSGFTFDGMGKIVFNPQGAVALRITDNFTRSNEAPNGAGFDSQEEIGSYNRVYNNVGASLLIQPGGKILTLDLGGSFSVYRHNFTTDLNRQTLGVEAVLKWKFLPQTAFTLLFDWDFNSYEVECRSIPFHPDTDGDCIPDDPLPSHLEDFLGSLVNVDSKPMRIQGGIAGLLGARVSLVLLGGWGIGFYESGEDFSSFIGRAEFAYEIGPMSRFRLGYMRDFSDSSFTNFFSFHKVYGRYNQQIGRRFELGIEGAFQLREFSTFQGPVLSQVSVDEVLGAQAFSSDTRVDPLVLAKAEGTVILGDFVTIGARYQLDVNTSDFVQITGIVADVEDQDPNNINTKGTATAQFVKHRVFLTTGVRW
jgi:hypothetical protein